MEKYNKGDIILLKEDGSKFPGLKQLTKGEYVILSFRKAFSTEGYTYVIKSTRKNSTYEFVPFQEWLENNSELKNG